MGTTHAHRPAAWARPATLKTPEMVLVPFISPSRHRQFGPSPEAPGAQPSSGASTSSEGPRPRPGAGSGGALPPLRQEAPEATAPRPSGPTDTLQFDAVGLTYRGEVREGQMWGTGALSAGPQILASGFFLPSTSWAHGRQTRSVQVLDIAGQARAFALTPRATQAGTAWMPDLGTLRPLAPPR